MTEYTVAGARADGSSELSKLGVEIPVRRAVEVSPTSRSGEPTTSIEIGDDDLIEVTLEDGLVFWTTIDRLRDDALAGGVRGGAGTLPVRYPARRDGDDRGLVDRIIRSIKVLGYDLPKGGALFVADKIEKQLAGEGFLSVGRDGATEAGAPDASDAPTLVLIHGTASATANAYAGFFDPKLNLNLWQQLHAHYDGRTFAFEHRTLTQSPLENAIALLRALPKRGAELHLVSHSRGGLVGDLLALGELGKGAFDLDAVKREVEHAFGKGSATSKAQIGLYRDVLTLLDEKRPVVSRFVRVGCPAAGTTLASGRLDSLLSILVNLAAKVPGVGPFLEGFGEFVAAVAKERTKPEVLPGLEAQRPSSPFVRLLNATPKPLTNDLTVLAGDSDGFVKNLANLFFWGANDLVVDTRAMEGGARREQHLWHLEENSEVTHTNYFTREPTAALVARGLMRDDGDDAGYERRGRRALATARGGTVDAGEPDEQTDRVGVVLVPGIMGSHLKVVDGDDTDRVWLDTFDILRGKGAKLRDGAARIEPDGLLGGPYDDLRDVFTRYGLHVMPMAYDWRKSLREAAKRLATVVQARLDASREPVHLLAHSMGGLVSSLFIAEHADVWNEVRRRGGRLVQAGTPNHGSYVIPRILTGCEGMLRLLAGIDLSADTAQWAAWASAWQGVLEMAPQRDHGFDFSKVSTWRDTFAVPKPPSAERLRKAAEVREILAAQTSRLAEHGVIYVAGGPTPTPIGDDAPRDEAGIAWTNRGDGRVLWETGVPPNVPLYFIPTKHGDLLCHRRSFTGLRQLLLDGTTDRLARALPPTSATLRGGEPAAPPLAGRDEVAFVPSLAQLEAAAVGGDDPATRRHDDDDTLPSSPCAISVVHGDLRYSRLPILVGHYAGDPIVHAESALDERLDGALRRQHTLNLYPGDVGTAEVLLHGDDEGERDGPRGAVVIGLGSVGELSPGALTTSIEGGLLRFAQAESGRRGDGPLEIGTLLVGSGEAGLPITQIIEAIAGAVLRANKALARLASDGEADAARRVPTIGHVEIIELYHDIALEALHALRRREEDPGLVVRPCLSASSGGLFRLSTSAAPPWWTRLAIQEDPHSVPRDESPEQRAARRAERLDLQFTAYGERARARVDVVHLQPRIVDTVLRETLTQSRSDGAVSEALFELLVPTPMKAGAADQNNVQLLLDDVAACYPWELLIDREAPGRRPLGIGAGLLRQLRVRNAGVVQHPEARVAFVVGDPPSGYPELEGAQHEALGVAERLNAHGWTVHRQVRHNDPISASSVVRRLLTCDPRILHLAGHGEHDPRDPRRSGLVLGGSPDDPAGRVMLTVAELAQLRLKPEIVFINCCHLGRVDRDTSASVPFPELAANLAVQFVRDGVKAVIAAGWAVDDAAAVTFSTTFYDRMLAGTPFGDAVRAARLATHRAHPATNTWGAYQCYGDPGFRLTLRQGATSAPPRSEPRTAASYADAAELVYAARNIASRAKTKDREDLSEELKALGDAATALDWRTEGGVLSALARAHLELGELDEAIDVFTEATSVDGSGVTLGDLEQRANAHVRRGKTLVDLAKDPEQDDAQRVKHLDAAEKDFKTGLAELTSLVKHHGSTTERESMLGGATRRMVELDIARRATQGKRAVSATHVRAELERMTVHYVRAAESAKKDWFYPANNALLGVTLLGGPWASRPTRAAEKAAHESLSKALGESADSWIKADGFVTQRRKSEQLLPRTSHPDFWHAIAHSELTLLSALAMQSGQELLPACIKRARSTIDALGSPREHRSFQSAWTISREVAAALGQETIASRIDAFLEGVFGSA